MVGSKCTRSKTAVTTQSLTDLSLHDIATSWEPPLSVAEAALYHPSTVGAIIAPAAVVPPLGSVAKSSFLAATTTPLCGPVTSTILQSQGLSISSSSWSNARQHNGATLQPNVIAHGQLGDTPQL
ncbi:hypothetical protein L3X38_005108 [Prunus dulcis]|uniref:Uncharacterized protein n=1 Tax=Prunus dulcis TaxID=3755 RepID=A0AAD5F3T2_PRUDU|nr:hypothetical protein L3X38_005108 [Prunus dulcis]